MGSHSLFNCRPTYIVVGGVESALTWTFLLLWQYQPGKFDPREGFTHHGLGQDIHYPVRLAGWLLLTWVYLVSRFKDSILRASSQPSTKRGGKKSADTFTDWRMVPLLLDVGRRSTVLLCPASFFHHFPPSSLGSYPLTSRALLHACLGQAQFLKRKKKFPTGTYMLHTSDVR